MSEPIERPSARIVVLDQEDRILLFRYVDGGAWSTPGGALETGETHADAAVRELHEEVGLTGVLVQPLNWIRGPIIWTWSWNGKTYASRERFFLARAPAAFVVESPGLVEGEVIAESRWWSVAEIEEAPGAGVTVWPSRLPELVRALLQDGPSDEVVDIGV